MPQFSRAAAVAKAITADWAGAPGGSFVLFDENGIRAQASNGLASLEHGIAFTQDTPSRFASISKHFLAVTLLRAGIDLSRPLGTWLPHLPTAIAAVPLVRALDMTGGLPDMMEVLWQQGVPFTASLLDREVDSVLQRIDRLCAEPGTEMAYSNTGWRLGQAVLETLGRPYREVLRAELFDPLGLGLDFPHDAAEPVAGLATGYWSDGGEWRRGHYGLHFSASGGITGSAADLARWSAALMRGDAPLAGALDRLLAPRAFLDGTPSAYRLGLVEMWLGTHRLAAHGGSLPGYRNHLLLAPDAGVGVVLMMNRDEDPVQKTLEVMAALLDETLPSAGHDMPPGCYAAEEGPFWAEVTTDSVVFMGGAEALMAPAGGRVRSLHSTLEVDLAVCDGALEGRIGGAPRRLLPVSTSVALDPALVGRWRETSFNVELTIHADGTATWPWAGGVGRDITLQPLPGGRALATLSHTLWRHRPCLWLDRGKLRVASHRARVLGFERV